jgi:hypothetical protein
MSDVIKVLDAHIKLAEDLGMIIEYISMPFSIAEKLTREIESMIPTNNDVSLSTIKTYRDIPIRVVENSTVKVCYAISDVFSV